MCKLAWVVFFTAERVILANHNNVYYHELSNYMNPNDLFFSSHYANIRRNMEIKTMCAFENEQVSFAICMKHQYKSEI